MVAALLRAPQGGKAQGGRRYFSSREITAVVGGPVNLTIYRHILVIPPTAKVVTAKKTQNYLPPKHYRRKNTAVFWIYRFRQNKTPTLDTAKKYRQLSIPPKECRQLSIPPIRYRQHRIPPKRHRRHWIQPELYRRYWIPPKMYGQH